jgi:hypothetical protein
MTSLKSGIRYLGADLCLYQVSIPSFREIALGMERYAMHTHYTSGKGSIKFFLDFERQEAAQL